MSYERNLQALVEALENINEELSEIRALMQNAIAKHNDDNDVNDDYDSMDIYEEENY